MIIEEYETPEFKAYVDNFIINLDPNDTHLQYAVKSIDELSQKNGLNFYQCIYNVMMNHKIKKMRSAPN